MEIDFDKQLYHEEAVRQAIADYREIAHVIFQPTMTGFRCSFLESKYDLQLTRLEFCNYVLSLSVAMDGNSYDYS